MNKVNTNKKLELVRAIRMQNHYNRQLFRSREGFLYPELPQSRQPELYSLEAENDPALTGRDKGGGSSFRLRFVIAMALLLLFILCDINQISYGNETTDTLFEKVVSSPDFGDFLDGQDADPYNTRRR